jgi:hypothetical protein
VVAVSARNSTAIDSVADSRTVKLSEIVEATGLSKFYANRVPGREVHAARGDMARLPASW